MNPHFVEILKAFRDEAVEYLLIGAHALAAHGHVRATLDIDCTRNAWLPPLSGLFLGSTQSLPEAGHLAASLMPRVRQDSEVVDIDHGKVFGRHVKDEAVVVGLNELAPIGRWAAGRRDVRRLERFAKMGQDLPDRPWLRDEGNQPDVTPAIRAPQRKLLPHPRHELGPRNPGGVVRAGAFDSHRSSLPWHVRRPHARAVLPRPAC
mgnify:CR=1 FL=1